jgi:hypothetical protein
VRSSISRFLIFSLFIFCISGSLSASRFDIVSVDKSKLPDINASLRYVKSDRTYYFGLTKKDFMLFINNKKASFKLTKNIERSNISLLLIIDASFSIKTKTRNLIKKAASDFISRMRKGDRAALFIFNDKTYKLSDFTSDKNYLIKKINAFKAAGRYSRLYDAIRQGSIYLNTYARYYKKAILVFSDGFDEGSSVSINETIKIAKEYDIPILASGYTNINPVLLKSLQRQAEETGGIYSREDEVDIASKIFSQRKEALYKFFFTLDNPVRENNILIKEKQTGKEIKFKIEIGSGALTFVKKEIRRRKTAFYLFYGGIILGVLLLLLVLFYILRRVRNAEGRDKSGLYLVTKDKKSKTLIYSLELGEEQRALIEKLIESQISLKDNNSIEYYKSVFNSDVLTGKNLDDISELICEFLNNTPYFGFEDTKELYKISESLKELNLSKNARVLTKTLFLSEARFSHYRTLLKLMHPETNRKREKPDLFKKSPKLLELFNYYSSKYNLDRDENLEELNLADTDKGLNDLIDSFIFAAFFSGKDGRDLSSTLTSLFGMDKETLMNLIPFMIHVVKETEGVEKEANLSLLKKLASGFDLSIDDKNDIGNLENWWKKNKDDISKKVNRINREAGNSKLFENGLYYNDDIILYALSSEGIEEIEGKVVGGDKYSVNVITRKKALLEEIMCFYRPDLSVNDAFLRINDHIFTRLIEITKIEDATYKMDIFFVPSNLRNDEDVIKLSNLYLKGDEQ